LLFNAATGVALGAAVLGVVVGAKRLFARRA
jgi:hypothetical protein